MYIDFNINNSCSASVHLELVIGMDLIDIDIIQVHIDINAMVYVFCRTYMRLYVRVKRWLCHACRDTKH